MKINLFFKNKIKIMNNYKLFFQFICLIVSQLIDKIAKFIENIVHNTIFKSRNIYEFLHFAKYI